MERPSHFPDPDHPLLLAARYNDAFAEEHGLQGTVESVLDVPFETVKHVAEQRAIRVVMIRNPARLVSFQEQMKRGAEAQALPFTEEETAEITTLTMVYLDAIALGWKAKELTDDN